MAEFGLLFLLIQCPQGICRCFKLSSASYQNLVYIAFF